MTSPCSSASQRLKKYRRRAASTSNATRRTVIPMLLTRVHRALTTSQRLKTPKYTSSNTRPKDHLFTNAISARITVSSETTLMDYLPTSLDVVGAHYSNVGERPRSFAARLCAWHTPRAHRKKPCSLPDCGGPPILPAD